MKYFIIFSLLFLSSCFSEYREHYFAEHSPESVSSELRIPSFASGEVLVLPDKGVEEKLISLIDSAKTRIWIEIYTWTDKNLLDAVLRAVKRGVDVRVVLEWNVYGTPTINRNVFDALKNAEIPVVYADNHRYTFTHAKFWIIDQEYFVSTGNWTISFFTKNRDAIFVDTDRTMLGFLEKVFLADFAHSAFLDVSQIPHDVIISPLNSRESIESIIKSTKKEILIYVQTLTDDGILQKLEELSHSWITIKICVADNEENHKILSQKMQFPLTFMKKPYLHGKFILQDSENVFLWSQNFTKNSLENNREIGLFIRKNIGIYWQLYSLFQKDCNF